MKKLKHVDIIILSWAKNDYLHETTKTGIDSLLNSDPGVIFHIYVVETNRDINYDEYNKLEMDHTVTTCRKELPFNYFKYSNSAMVLGNSEYLCICNNDLTYEKNWATNIINVMEHDPTIMSASPWCPQTQGDNKQFQDNTYLGYRVRVELAGWCIFQQRKLYDIIGIMNEDTDFWYGDDIYADELRMRDIKHGLVCNSVVNHHDGNLGKTATNALDAAGITEFTTNQRLKYENALEKLKTKLNSK